MFTLFYSIYTFEIIWHLLKQFQPHFALPYSEDFLQEMHFLVLNIVNVSISG